MPRIQLIIEADSANQLSHIIKSMAHRYKDATTGEALPDPSLVVTARAAGNGSAEPDVPAEFTPTAPENFPKIEPESPTPPARRGRKAAAAKEPPAQPEEAPEPPPSELPALDDLKQAITKAVVAEPHGGPIRTALETLRPTLKINLIRNATEEHRAALFAFVQQQQIPLDQRA